MASSSGKRQRDNVDNRIIVLALKAPEPLAAGKKGATTSRKTTEGQRKNRNEAAPRGVVTEDEGKNCNAATRNAVTKGCPGFPEKPKSVNNVHPTQEDSTGVTELQKLANTKDILGDSACLTKEQHVVNNDQGILEEQSGVVQENNPGNVGEDIPKDTAGFAEEPIAAENEQQIVVEQAGIVQQQQNAQEEIQAEDPAVMNHIYDFALKNPLADDLDFQLMGFD